MKQEIKEKLLTGGKENFLAPILALPRYFPAKKRGFLVKITRLQGNFAPLMRVMVKVTTHSSMPYQFCFTSFCRLKISLWTWLEFWITNGFCLTFDVFVCVQVLTKRTIRENFRCTKTCPVYVSLTYQGTRGKKVSWSFCNFIRLNDAY